MAGPKQDRIDQILQARGIYLRRSTRRPEAAFEAEAAGILRRARGQSPEEALSLAAHYSTPIFGDVTVWDLLVRLGGCIDPCDVQLYGASQQLHVLQILEGMEADGVDDPDLLMTAVIHDMGKLLLLVGADPAQVVGGVRVLRDEPAGIGLDNCAPHWSANEFAYLRFRDHVPDHVSWMVRHHSTTLDEFDHVLDRRDRDYRERYLVPFLHYDYGTKSSCRIPRKAINHYRDLVDGYFATPIAF